MKKFFLLIVIVFMAILVSGCDLLKRDSMEDISIITTSYPFEYITNKLYGKHALVVSIYPDETNIDTYEFSSKQLNDFAKKDLFIYAGVSRDKDVARELLNRNNDLLIIDGSFGMKPNYLEEIWLNPANMLMLSQNIKNGLVEYINNSYLIKEIEEAHEKLKIQLSELDADIQLTCENATNKTIVTSSDSLKYLEKYGLTVISLAGDNVLDKTISEVTDLIKKGEINYIFSIEGDKNSDAVKTLISNTGIKELTLRRLDIITEKERNNKDDYIKLMNNNIELLKKDIYK